MPLLVDFALIDIVLLTLYFSDETMTKQISPIEYCFCLNAAESFFDS